LPGRYVADGVRYDPTRSIGPVVTVNIVFAHIEVVDRVVVPGQPIAIGIPRFRYSSLDPIVFADLLLCSLHLVERLLLIRTIQRTSGPAAPNAHHPHLLLRRMRHDVEARELQRRLPPRIRPTPRTGELHLVATAPRRRRTTLAHSDSSARGAPSSNTDGTISGSSTCRAAKCAANAAIERVAKASSLSRSVGCLRSGGGTSTFVMSLDAMRPAATAQNMPATLGVAHLWLSSGRAHAVRILAAYARRVASGSWPLTGSNDPTSSR